MIVTLGEVLVELMAETVGDGWREPIALRGPFPSGAPAIFIDQVGRLGVPAGMIGAVGRDDFGAAVLDRLRRDGVDVRAIRVDDDRPTGTAFVRYRASGARDFVFNIRHSAAAQLRLDEAARDLLGRARHLHVMGSSLFTPELAAAALEAATTVRADGGTVSFDPNIRKEMAVDAASGVALRRMLDHCDLFLPSGDELTLLTDATDEAGAIDELLRRGIGAVVLKRGADGASYRDRALSLDQGGFAVAEIDPTGAGDCFGATFVACRSLGHPPARALRYAAASGALAVSAKGPMEGASSFALLDAFLASRGA